MTTLQACSLWPQGHAPSPGCPRGWWASCSQHTPASPLRVLQEGHLCHGGSEGAPQRLPLLHLPQLPANWGSTLAVSGQAGSSQRRALRDGSAGAVAVPGSGHPPLVLLEMINEAPLLGYKGEH